MKITLYMAMSIDGFIAKENGDSDWVSPVDTDNFMAKIHEKGCLIVGRKTYEQFYEDLYPVEGVTNIVVTSKEQNSDSQNVHFLTGSPSEIVKEIEELGHSEALLIGGGITNASFLEAGLIDEVILTVHPLILGKGISLFEGNAIFQKLELIKEEKLEEGLVSLVYKFIK